MIQEMSKVEIDQVDGGALEGAAATAGLLATGFGALAAVPRPASPALATAAAVTGVIAIGIGYFGAVYGSSSSSSAQGGDSFRQPNVKLK